MSIYIAYYITLLGFLIASFFPEHRCWGVNWWAYFPDLVRWGLFGLGLLVPVALHYVARRIESKSAEESSIPSGRMYFVVAALVAVVAVLLFYFLRARTYFQGDGYTLLSELAKNSPFAMKTREFGESIVHIGLRDLIGGDAQAAALLAHQIISIGAGLLFILLTGWYSSRLYDRLRERVLFLLGVCSGGYMLLFFGYVENYSLFVLSVMVYTMTGILIAQGKAGRVWILPPLLAAAFFHVLGVTLLPSALYLWIGPTRFGRSIRKWKWAARLIALSPVAIVGGYVIYHFYTTSYFFRFAFIPLWENRFTVEGYTLFSWKHLVDYLNLLLLLVPGLLLAIAALYRLATRNLVKQRQYVYLIILLASVLGAVFIFDPKLGMPRDWDLFSFAGVPLTILVINLILSSGIPIRSRVQAIGCIIALAAIVMIPRSLILADTERGQALIERQIHLDKQKNKNAVALLGNYYLESGDAEDCRRIRDYAKRAYPEDAAHDETMSSIAKGHYVQAEKSLRQIVEQTPSNWTAWTSLGACYFYMNKLDSAMNALDIALGWNPGGPRASNNKAAVYLKRGEFEAAEELWLSSYERDTLSIEPLVGLVELYKATREEQKYYRCLRTLNVRTGAPVNLRKELGDYLLKRKQYRAAAEVYREALDGGLDSAYVQDLLSKDPDLAREWK